MTRRKEKKKKEENFNIFFQEQKIKSTIPITQKQ